MTVDAAIRLRLLACTPVTSLVAARVYTLILPENVKVSEVGPSIRVQRISHRELMHLRGPIGLFRARVQVDSVGKSKAVADAVDAAVQGDGLGSSASGLKGWIGSIGSPAIVITGILPAGVEDGYEPPPLQRFKVMRDFFVHFEGTQ